MTQDNSWRGEYARLIAQMVGADPLIGRASIAERLAVPEDDLDQILGVDWRDRATCCQPSVLHDESLTRRTSDVHLTARIVAPGLNCAR
jgi:hypothetical protein